jgi:hypothetical protein
MSIHNHQEAVMGKAIPSQHPAVVLRSQFNFVRNLLAVAMVAVIGLSVAVVIVANDADEVASTTSARPIDSINYGGFNPATGRPDAAPSVAQQAQAQALPGGTRYDGGPEEGTRGMTQQRSVPAPGTRYDGGPEEGSRGITPAAPPAERYDGGPEEGTRGPGFRSN